MLIYCQTYSNWFGKTEYHIYAQMDHKTGKWIPFRKNDKEIKLIGGVLCAKGKYL